MCRPYLLIEDLSDEQKDLLIAKRNGKFFGTGSARIAIINSLMRLKLVGREGYHPTYGRARWALTPCGIRAGNFLHELDQYPLLRGGLIDQYEERRYYCLVDPPKPSFLRNPQDFWPRDLQF